MPIKKEFTDVTVVGKNGKIEYFYGSNPNYREVGNDKVIGTSPQQQYKNLSENESSLIKAVKKGRTSRELEQELLTTEGEKIIQLSDTYTIKDGEEVIGAIDFARVKERAHLPGKEENIDETRKLTLDNIVGSCNGIQILRSKIEKIKDLDSPVIIIGKTGTGKGMTARIIHSTSKRSDKPFIYVNCRAITPERLERVLFGVESGSFDGVGDKTGVFEMANHGTIFFDEINDMPDIIQGKILRAIEYRKIRPVGASEEISVDVRIISSCSQSIDSILRNKGMRKDLYFRLAAILLETPPLRARGGDIVELTDYFIEQLNNMSLGKKIKGVSNKGRKFLAGHDWTGNVRELKNTIEEAYIVADTNMIEYEDIVGRFKKPAPMASGEEEYVKEFWDSGDALKQYMDKKNKGIIVDALSESDGNLKECAKILGLTSQMLRYNLNKYEIEV